MAGATKAKEVGYVPSPDFEEDNKESLIDIEMNEDTELWFIQFADDQVFIFSLDLLFYLNFLNLLFLGVSR